VGVELGNRKREHGLRFLRFEKAALRGASGFVLLTKRELGDQKENEETGGA
jgi:hypothetical protein